MAQYGLNIYKIDGLQEAERREELNIVFGIGSQQQLGYYEDEADIYDSLFPFDFSIVWLLLLAIFTRYVGKPKFRGGKRQYDQDGKPIPRKRGDMTDNSSERRALTTEKAGGREGEEKDTLTENLDYDDNISGFTDLRSQQHHGAGILNIMLISIIISSSKRRMVSTPGVIVMKSCLRIGLGLK